MMSLKGKIERLEDELGTEGLCACPGPAYEIRVYEPDPAEGSRHLFPTEPDDTPAICPKCGRERRLAIIKIVRDR